MESLSAGTRINRYEIVECIRNTELIGFYKAYDTKLERFVFLKLVLHGADYSKESIAYFLDEAKALAKLSHQNIVKVLDFGYTDENLYLINEYTEGQTLSEMIRAPLGWRRAIKILLPITEALSYAHSKGIIHRDLRPENIIITEDDQPLLSDFSLMRIIEDEETRDMTGTNVGLGSPAYLSPEQGKGLSVDFRSDIYSLGVVFFEMITGQKPFNADSSMEIVIQHVMKKPPRPSSLIPDLPIAVEEIILTSLAKDLNKRYQTMEEFADALRSVLSTDAGAASKPGKISTTMIVLLGLIGLGLVISGFWIWKSRNTGAVAATSTLEAIPSLNTPTKVSTESPTQGTNPEETPVGESVTSTVSPEAGPTPGRADLLLESPVLPGAKIPASSQIINHDNAQNIVELARLGMPRINQLLFIDNGQILVAATSAGLYFIDASTLNPKYLLDTKGWLASFAISKDQKWVATGDVNGNVAVWNIITGENIATFESGLGEITALDISPDKARIAFSTQSSIEIWDLNQKASLFKIRKNGLRINKLYFISDGNLFITGGEDFQIAVWDAQAGKRVWTKSASQKINDLSVSNDGKYVALALENATIEIWDITKRELQNKIQNSQIVQPFTCVNFLPNNQVIVAGSKDGVARIWNISGKEIIWETPPKTEDGALVPARPLKTLAVSENGAKAAILGEDGVIDLWDISQRQLITSQDLNSYAINRLAVSPDGQEVAYQLGNSFVDIYAIQGEKRISRINGTLPRGSPISADSTKILIKSNDLGLYSLSPNDTQYLYTLYNSPIDGLVNFILDDKIVAVSSAMSIQIWSTSVGRELVAQTKKNEGICSVIYRLDGNFLAAGSAIGVLSQENNFGYFCKVSPNPRATSRKFLPNGSIIAFSVEYQTIEIWNMVSDKKQTIISKAPGHMLDVAISNDGTLLAAASASGVIEIYDLATLELLQTLDTHTSKVNQITFSNDQKYLISGSDDGTVRIWGLQP